MDRFIFKKISEPDVPALCELYFQLTGNEPDKDKIIEFLKHRDDNSDFSLFGAYTADGLLIASASLTRCFDLTDEGRDYYNLENFIVDKRYRRKGAGTFLMKKIEEFVISRNGRYINFTSSASRKGAHAFYETLGYKKNYVLGFKKIFNDNSGES